MIVVALFFTRRSKKHASVSTGSTVRNGASRPATSPSYARMLGLGPVEERDQWAGIKQGDGCHLPKPRRCRGFVAKSPGPPSRLPMYRDATSPERAPRGGRGTGRLHRGLRPTPLCGARAPSAQPADSPHAELDRDRLQRRFLRMTHLQESMNCSRARNKCSGPLGPAAGEIQATAAPTLGTARECKWRLR